MILPRAPAALLALLSGVGAACGSSSPAASPPDCAAPLTGVWQPEGSPHRWAVLERGAALEAYPIFDDTAGAGDAVVSPRRVIAVRGKTAFLGRVERWVMREARSCSLRAPVRIECRPGGLRFELPELLPPSDFVTCQSPPSAASPQRWRRAARW